MYYKTWLLFHFITTGLYLPADDLDVPLPFRGIGIRIEDDVLITSDAPKVLSAECPKEMSQIESLVNKQS